MSRAAKPLGPATNLALHPTPKARIARNGVLRRAEMLDVFDGILSFERRNRLAAVLSDEDVAALAQLSTTGMRNNSLRALASDLAYLTVWAKAATGWPLPWPAPEMLLMAFVTQHLSVPDHDGCDGLPGMPQEVIESLVRDGYPRSSGPHAPATVRRRLASWSTLTRCRQLTGAFDSPALKNALRLAVADLPRSHETGGRTPVTKDILELVLRAAQGETLVDCRDRALLLITSASGGRRADIAGMRCEDLVFEEEPVSGQTGARRHRRLFIRADVETGRGDVVLTGRPVEALQQWLQQSAITSGPVFRRIDRWGHVMRLSLTPQSVNLILKSRLAAAGLDPAAFSTESLRAASRTKAKTLPPDSPSPAGRRSNMKKQSR